MSFNSDAVTAKTESIPGSGSDHSVPMPPLPDQAQKIAKLYQMFEEMNKIFNPEHIPQESGNCVIQSEKTKEFLRQFKSHNDQIVGINNLIKKWAENI